MFQRFEVARVLALVLAFSAVNPSFAVNPDHLDIRLNESLYKSEGKKVIYGTIVQIDGLKDWTHGNVVDLAFAAHTKFRKQWDVNTNTGSPDRILGLHPKNHKPSVTTTFVVDNTAYIATSLKAGRGSYIYDMSSNNAKDDMAGVHIQHNHPLDNAVLDGLRECQAFAVDTDRAHKNSANCGEFMAALAFCIDTGRRDLDNARMVAITTTRAGNDEIFAPCDNFFKEGKQPLLEQWGCTAFAMLTQIKVLTEADGREAVEVSEEDLKKGTRPQISYP